MPRTYDEEHHQYAKVRKFIRADEIEQTMNVSQLGGEDGDDHADDERQRRQARQQADDQQSAANELAVADHDRVYAGRGDAQLHEERRHLVQAVHLAPAGGQEQKPDGQAPDERREPAHTSERLERSGASLRDDGEEHGLASFALAGLPGLLARFAQLSLVALAAAGCVQPRSSIPNAVGRADVRTVPAPANGKPAWRYEVRSQDRELAVEAAFEPTNDEVFSVDGPAAPYVEQVEIAPLGNERGFGPAAARGAGFFVPCHAGCRVRYRFALGRAADALHDIDLAIGSGDALIAPPSTWLLSPLSAPPGVVLEFHVDSSAPGGHFASGFQRSPSARADTYVLPAAALDDSSFTAFGALHVTEVPAGDTTIRLAVAPKNLGLSPEQAESWIAAAAGAVAHYYQGHLPARHTLIVLMKGAGASTRGETLGGGGPAVVVRASDLVSPTTTRDDWVVSHELLHANFPDLGRAHAWLSEGLATYLEPVARSRVGLVDAQKFWRDLIEGLPQGLPEAGDRGLENTHTWGRTYWGGALYCLVADVTIRERTGNARSLDDVIRAIGKTGDTDDVAWGIERFLAAGQQATNTPVLHELYAELAQKPGSVNLSELFTRLGVRLERGSVLFDDSAPLAQIRRSITAG